jgi:hypothetical protein
LKLAPNERVAGFIYIGSPTEQQPDRERPQLAKIVTRWTRLSGLGLNSFNRACRPKFSSDFGQGRCQ